MVPFDKLAYEKFYNFNGERYGHVNTRPGIRLHYNYYAMGKSQRRNALKLKQLTDMNDQAKCILIGAGFGWTCEGLMEHGIEAVGTEISEWVLAEKDNTEEGDLREYIIKTGLDPDNDDIIGNPLDSRCTVYVPEYKQDGFDKWIVGPEAEARRNMIVKWEAKSEKEKKVARVNMNNNDFNPVMPKAPKPEYMINPLECFLQGGRAAPQPRTSVIIVGEGLDTFESRNTVRRLLSDSPTHIITEEVLNSVSNEDGLVLCENLMKMARTHGGNIYHIISANEPNKIWREYLNWKTNEEWHLHLKSNGFEDQKIISSIDNSTIDINRKKLN